MNPSIEAAWIAGSSGFLGVLVGVTGTAVVARLGFKSTRAATDATVAAGLTTARDQIEADRRSRIWEKRADTYTDFVAVIQHRQDVREAMWQEEVEWQGDLAVLTGAEPERPAPTVDATQVEARLIAYASNKVIRASREAGAAGRRYETEIANWAKYVKESRMPPPISSPEKWPRPAADVRAVVEQARKEANRLDDVLTDLIRAELHAGAGQPPAPPEPLAPPPSPGAD